MYVCVDESSPIRADWMGTAGLGSDYIEWKCRLQREPIPFPVRVCDLII